MEIPQVLALPLKEAARRLEAAGCSYEVQSLLPPRASEADFEGREVRRYVVSMAELVALMTSFRVHETYLWVDLVELVCLEIFY